MKQLLPLVFILFGYSLTAQIDDYNIADYVTPDYTFQSLEINPSLVFRKGFLDQTTFDVDSRLSYFREKLTRKNITTNEFSLFVDYLKTKSISDTTQRFNMLGDYYGKNQFFYKPKRFITLDLDGTLQYFESKSDETFYLGSATLNLKPHWGMGRVERITDAWHTKEILKALRKKGLLKNEPTTEQLEALAIEITRIKTTRVIDFRFDQIYELEQLAALLHTDDLIDTESFSFFATLNDAWLYESYIRRRSGSSFQIGPTFETTLNRFSEDPIIITGPGIVSATATSDRSYAIESIYEKYAAKGDFQIDFKTSLTYGRNRRMLSNTNADDLITNFIEWMANLEIYYLLSSRINFRVGLISEASWINDLDSQFLNLNYGLNYFVAPRLILNAGAYLSLQDSRNFELRESTGFNFSLRYFIR